MSTPAGQLLCVKDLKRLQNLRSDQYKIKATKIEMSQYNEMKEEIVQFMLLKKQKLEKNINHFASLPAANDETLSVTYTKRRKTHLID